jgi:hypothetical protein
MFKLPSLRTIAITALALGAFQLNTAQAAEPAWMAGCDEEAYELGYATCEEGTGGDWEWGIIWYRCDEQGVSEAYVECYGSSQQ